MSQLTARNCLIHVLNQPSHAPPGGKKIHVTHCSNTIGKVVWGKETGEIRVVMEREKEVEGTQESKEMMGESTKTGKTKA